MESNAQAYASEKADHLETFGNDAIFGNTDKHEQFRDALLDANYISPHGLQARMWKMALKDSYETVLKNWAELASDLQGRVARVAGWSKEQKQYANWLLGDGQRRARVVGESSPISDHIALSLLSVILKL